MDFIIFIILIILTGIYLKRLLKIKVRPTITILIKVVYLITIGIMAFLTYKLQESILHISIGIIACIFMIINFYQFGIIESGFTTFNVPSFLIKWEDIKTVNIMSNKNAGIVSLKVNSEKRELTQVYKYSDFDDIKKILNEHIDKNKIRAK